LDGTRWTANAQGWKYVLTFKSPNFTLTGTGEGETGTQTGTYTISGSTITFTPTGEDSVTATLSWDIFVLSGITFTKQ